MTAALVGNHDVRSGLGLLLGLFVVCPLAVCLMFLTTLPLLFLLIVAVDSVIGSLANLAAGGRFLLDGGRLIRGLMGLQGGRGKFFPLIIKIDISPAAHRRAHDGRGLHIRLLDVTAGHTLALRNRFCNRSCT